MDLVLARELLSKISGVSQSSTNITPFEWFITPPGLERLPQWSYLNLIAKTLEVSSQDLQKSLEENKLLIACIFLLNKICHTDYQIGEPLPLSWFQPYVDDGILIPTVMVAIVFGISVDNLQDELLALEQVVESEQVVELPKKTEFSQFPPIEKPSFISVKNELCNVIINGIVPKIGIDLITEDRIRQFFDPTNQESVIIEEPTGRGPGVVPGFKPITYDPQQLQNLLYRFARSKSGPHHLDLIGYAIKECAADILCSIITIILEANQGRGLHYSEIIELIKDVYPDDYKLVIQLYPRYATDYNFIRTTIKNCLEAASDKFYHQGQKQALRWFWREVGQKEQRSEEAEQELDQQAELEQIEQKQITLKEQEELDAFIEQEIAQQKALEEAEIKTATEEKPPQLEPKLEIESKLEKRPIASSLFREKGRKIGDPQREFFRLIRAVGGKLIRTKNHDIYEIPGGKKLTVPKTPSDHRAWMNTLADLRRALRRAGYQRNPTYQSIYQRRNPIYQNTDLLLEAIQVLESIIKIDIRLTSQEDLIKILNQELVEDPQTGESITPLLLIASNLGLHPNQFLATLMHPDLIAVVDELETFSQKSWKPSEPIPENWLQKAKHTGKYKTRSLLETVSERYQPVWTEDQWIGGLKNLGNILSEQPQIPDHTGFKTRIKRKPI